jgi:two-component system cell cycle sensor histidine kinase/response regulator CckA
MHATPEGARGGARSEGEAGWEALRAHWPGYVLTIDGANRLLSLSRRTKLLDPRDSIGRDVVESLAPEDAAAARASYDSVRASGRAAAARCTVAVPGEARRSYECLCMPLRGRGDGALLLLVSDVTEHANAGEALAARERRFRALIERSHEGILLRDADGTTRYASPVAAALLGVGVSEVAETIQNRVIHQDDRERVVASEQALCATPGASVTIEFRMMHPDGTWHWIESTRTNLLDDPAVAAIVCNFRDVTERRALADQLTQAQKMEAIGSLASGVAHDFNNLLSAILVQADLCSEECEDPARAREDLAEIRQVALRAAALTRQLLAFARKQVLQPRVLSLNALVSEVERMLHRVIGEDVDLTTRLESDLGMVRCDPTHLTQVMLNLAVNARDAMPDGGRLEIRTANAQIDAERARRLEGAVAPGPYVVLSVTDTGTGMDEATMRRIFEPFFSTKAPGRGTGLGLSTVFGIVRQSGGAIAVESRLGEGSTFRVYLPRVAAEASPGARPPSAPVLGSGRTLLLVEDDPSARHAMARLLEQRGYRVYSAPGLVDARAILERAHVDVLLTDVILPDGDGPTLATLARAREPAMRVLFMSGYGSHERLERHLTAPGSEFLPKPFTAEQLESALRSPAA